MIETNTWHAVLLAIVVGESAAIAAMTLWSIFRELYVRGLVENHQERMEQAHGTSQDVIREVTSTLGDVTHTMATAVKTIENSTSITKETKTELIAAFNQSEARLTAMLDRLCRGQAPTISNFNSSGDTGQAGGQIHNRGTE